MRRDILRFPVGQQFRKILEDDHEWIILTDVHLKPIVMERSSKKESITRVEIEKAYYRLKEKIPEGKRVQIYDLHTHPRSGGMIPSSNDMKNFLAEKILNPFKISLAGHGVITKDGIFIVKLHGTTEKLKELYWNFPDEYRERSLTRLMDTVDSITPERVAAIQSGEIKRRKKTRDISSDAHIRAFDQMQREHPEIKTKTVRRPHRFNMSRRR